MVPNPAHHPRGDFVLRRGRLYPPQSGDERLTYAGLGWFRRSLFEDLPRGPLPLRPMLEECIRRGRLAGQRHTGRWIDIGSPERLQQARGMINH